MRFLYVAPRYHTNQIPIMKGLKERGHTVCFLSHYAGKIEDYSYLTPEVVGYSSIFKAIDYLYVHLLHRNDPKAADKKLLRGFPPIFRLSRRIRNFKPDIAVIRERSVYSMVTYLICRRYHIPAVLYNQSPLWVEAKNDLPHRIVRGLTPKVRMTPVMGSPGPGLVREENAFFVPFVTEAKLSPENRDYCKDGVLHIFSVGKYEKRKNTLMLAEIVNELSRKYPVHLTVAGECSTEFHQRYYNDVERYVTDHGLQDKITLLRNLNREEMDREYAKADLFVIPSTLEPASISQLEAMAFSVPVICSDTNGSACYVKEGHNGFQFKDNDKEDLQRVMEQFMEHPELVAEMGSRSYSDVETLYQFDNYYEGIEECIKSLS